MREYVKKKQCAQQPKPSAHTRALMQAEAVWHGGTVYFEAPQKVEFEGLTTEDIARIRRAQGTQTPNLERAIEVKKLIAKGFNRSQIAALLKHKGRGYGERLIHADYSALNPHPAKRQKK